MKYIYLKIELDFDNQDAEKKILIFQNLQKIS